MPTAADIQRTRVLRALGVTSYRLRTHAQDVASSLPADIPALADAPDSLALVTLLPQDAAARQLDLVGRALKGFGAHFARAPRIRVAAGQPAQPVPPAHVYLVFGRDQAQALGRAVPAAQVNAAQVLLVDTPEHLLNASGKRQLWQALKRARRALADVAARVGK